MLGCLLGILKEYYEANRERINKQHKEYYEKNKQQLKEYKKKYKKENAEQIREQNKEYREQNKEKAKQYRENNKEKKKEYRQVKCTCSCGSIFCKGDINRHIESKKHQNFLNFSETAVLIIVGE